MTEFADALPPLDPDTQANLDNLFSYHKPFGDQSNRYEALRSKAKELAVLILKATPRSADQQAALRKLRECVMTANAAIACNEIELANAPIPVPSAESNKPIEAPSLPGDSGEPAEPDAALAAAPSEGLAAALAAEPAADPVPAAAAAAADALDPQPDPAAPAPAPEAQEEVAPPGRIG